MIIQTKINIKINTRLHAVLKEDSRKNRTIQRMNLSKSFLLFRMMTNKTFLNYTRTSSKQASYRFLKNMI